MRVRCRLRPFMPVALSMLLASPALAGVQQSATPPPAKPTQRPLSDTDQEVVNASNAWFEAVLNADTEAVERLETDDFLTVQRTPKGVAVIDKPSQLQSLKGRTNAVFLQRELANVRVRHYGDTAVLTGLATLRGQQPKGVAVTTQAVVSEVWVKQERVWRISHFHPTELGTRKGQ